MLGPVYHLLSHGSASLLLEDTPVRTLLFLDLSFLAHHAKHMSV